MSYLSSFNCCDSSCFDGSPRLQHLATALHATRLIISTRPIILVTVCCLFHTEQCTFKHTLPNGTHNIFGTVLTPGSDCRSTHSADAELIKYSEMGTCQHTGQRTDAGTDMYLGLLRSFVVRKFNFLSFYITERSFTHTQSFACW